MGTSLKKAFKKAAIVIVFGAGTLTMACGVGQGAPQSDGGQSCVDAQTIRNPRTDGQKRLAVIFNKAASAPTGKALLDHAMKNGAKICFEPALAEANACGFVTIGRHDPNEKLLLLNPDSRISEDLIVKVLVHEARHKKVDDSYKAPWWGNVPEWEHVTDSLFGEADARTSSIVFAYELKNRGDDSYWNSLKGDSGHRAMIVAFEKSLAEKPDDMLAAMRASVLGFFEMSNYVRKYANNTAEWIERNQRQFDPDSPVTHLITEAYMESVGDMGIYGNYMDAETMQKIRAAYTDEDYKELAKARAESGGTKGAACKPPKKNASAELTS